MDMLPKPAISRILINEIAVKGTNKIIGAGAFDCWEAYVAIMYQRSTK